MPGANCNQVVHDAMVDLHALKKPDAKRFQKKNDIRPFEDASSLEFFSEKNDTSLLVLGSSNRKRPNNLTFARTFNFQIYDLIELRLENYKFLKDFRKTTFNIGLKPMFVFNGPAFDSHPTFQHIKSLFLDFFRGQVLEGLDVAGLQHIISISTDEVEEDKPLPKVYFRVYLLKTVRGDSPKLPRVELDEIGPSFDFIIGREQAASAEMEKEAFKTPRALEARSKKNIETDTMGDKIGRIHVGKQDIGKLQTRKMKGLKSKFDQNHSDDEEFDDDGEIPEEADDIIPEAPSKKIKTK